MSNKLLMIDIFFELYGIFKLAEKLNFFLPSLCYC